MTNDWDYQQTRIKMSYFESRRCWTVIMGHQFNFYGNVAVTYSRYRNQRKGDYHSLFRKLKNEKEEQEHLIIMNKTYFQKNCWNQDVQDKSRDYWHKWREGTESDQLEETLVFLEWSKFTMEWVNSCLKYTHQKLWSRSTLSLSVPQGLTGTRDGVTLLTNSVVLSRKRISKTNSPGINSRFFFNFPSLTSSKRSYKSPVHE